MQPKIIYYKVPINKGLLDETFPANTKVDDFSVTFSDYYRDLVTDTLPQGKLIGVSFNSYVDKSSHESDFLISKTEIRLENTRNQLITEPTDIRDYEDKQGGYLDKFKKIDFPLIHNETITISWETSGNRFPICGEFIFAIEEDCSCAT